MTRFTLLILIMFSLIAGSCSTRKNKPDHSNMIPDKDLVSILTDVYIADGLLTLPKIHHLFSSLDSNTSYYQIIEKHGYTKETMDKTMKYYFIKDPKKLIKIYDQVLGILSEMESIVAKEAILAEGRITNLWTGEESYFFPDPSGSDSSQFDLSINRPGLYTLVFTVILFPDDQSVNPQITAYSCRSDSLESGKRDYIKNLNYIKDGHPHTYTVTLRLPENTTLNFRGCLYDNENSNDECENHMIIKTISFTYSSAGVV